MNMWKQLPADYRWQVTHTEEQSHAESGRGHGRMFHKLQGPETERMSRVPEKTVKNQNNKIWLLLPEGLRHADRSVNRQWSVTGLQINTGWNIFWYRANNLATGAGQHRYRQLGLMRLSKWQECLPTMMVPEYGVATHAGLIAQRMVTWVKAHSGSFLKTGLQWLRWLT